MNRTKPILDGLLDSSRPHEFDGDDASLNMVRQVSSSARAAIHVRKRSIWKRPPVIAGGIGLLFLATTAGAILTFDPDGFLVDGNPTPYDVIIPIEYTTTSGQFISCTVGKAVTPIEGSDVSELKLFMESHDWTGIGQRIHDEAVANPFVPGPEDVWESDGQDVRDSMSFSIASGKVFDDEIADELQSPLSSIGGSSDCQGTL